MVVELGKTIAQVAEDLELNQSSVQRWVAKWRLEQQDGGVGAGVASGCTRQPGATGQGGLARTQREAAEDFYLCLNDAGLGVELIPLGPDEAAVEWTFETDRRILVRAPDSTGQLIIGGDAGPNDMTDSERGFISAAEGEWGLMIDGVDHSSRYAECRQTSAHFAIKSNEARPHFAINLI
jgi:hypothetical protein